MHLAFHRYYSYVTFGMWGWSFFRSDELGCANSEFVLNIVFSAHIALAPVFANNNQSHQTCLPQQHTLLIVCV